jgi:oligosaccharide repeat unit polymerase
LGKYGQEKTGVRAVVISINFLAFALIVLCSLLYENSMLGLRAEPLIVPTCGLLLAVCIWALWSWRKLTGSSFDPYIIFLVAAILFNGGEALLQLYYLIDSSDIRPGTTFDIFSPETNLETVFLVVLGLAAFHTGGLLSASLYRPPRIESLTKVVRGESGNAISKALRLVGWGLLAVSFVPTLLALRNSLAVVMSSGYFGLYQQEDTTSFNAAPTVLESFIIPACLFLLAGSKGYRINIAVSTITILSYCSAQFFLGERGWPAMLLFAYAWVWHRCVRPIPKAILLGAGGVLLFVLFPLIQVVREMGGEQRLSLGFLAEAFLSIDNPAVAIISEMGGSMQTIAYTLDLVPSMRDFDLGGSYFYALLIVFPNLFWEVHPSIARGTPSEWLVQMIDPVSAQSGGGYGYSFIAEAYLNFGWLGTPVVLGIMGFLFARLVLWAGRSGDPAKIAMIASFASFMLLFARGESNFLFRPLVWYSLIPFLMVYALTLCMRSESYPKRVLSRYKSLHTRRLLWRR